MAYTGTGTEANPFIPDTLTSFLECISVAEAYVRLDTDIDAADDPDYGGILYEPVTFKCFKCFGNNGIKKINGVIVRASNMIVVDNRYDSEGKIIYGNDVVGNSIYNVAFTNWVHKASTTATMGEPSIVLMYNADLNMCQFSFEKDGSSKSFLNFYDYAYIENVSFYVKATGCTKSLWCMHSTGATNYTVKKCNFNIDGGAFAVSSPLFVSSSASNIKLSEIGVVWKHAIFDLKYPSSNANMYFFGSGKNSGGNYIVFPDLINNASGENTGYKYNLRGDTVVGMDENGRPPVHGSGVPGSADYDETLSVLVDTEYLKDFSNLSATMFYP